MSPCLISISLVAMARATSTTTMPTSRGVKSSFGGRGATPNRRLAKPGISRCEARDYCAVVERVNKQLTVGSRGCHGLIPYSGGRGKPSIGRVYPGLWPRGLPPSTQDWRASACFRPQRHTQVTPPLDKPL